MSDEEDIEQMLEKWNDLDDLTLQGLRTLNHLIDKTILGRIEDGETYEPPLLQLPENPCERPCWVCRKWIKIGQQAAAYPDGKTYHLECNEKREKAE